MNNVTFTDFITPITAAWLNDVNDAAVDYNLVDAPRDGTDQTAAVNTVLAALGANGGLVRIPRGCKFNLQNLTLPIRSNIEYWMDDDLSRPNPSTTLGTNERVIFNANANASGIVNEYRVTAPFHPSWSLDLRRDVSGHDSFLGAGQARIPTASISGKASMNWFDQQVDTFRMQLDIFGGAYSQFNGVSTHSWRRVYTITGVGTGAYTSVPSVGTEITGSVSGAKGWFLASDSTTTTLLWNSGKFVVGDALIDNNETTSTTASSVAFSLQTMQPLCTDLRKGNWSFGLPPSLGDELLNLGGRLALVPTRDFSQYKFKTITHPGIVFSDLVADVPTNGYTIHYDTTAGAASRRLTSRKLTSGTESSQNISILSANRAFVQFTNSAIVSTSSFNVTSITRTGTGVYEINIPSGVFTTVDPCVTFGTEAALDYAICDWASCTTTKIVVKVFTTGTTTARDLTGRLSVNMTGGDI